MEYLHFRIFLIITYPLSLLMYSSIFSILNIWSNELMANLPFLYLCGDYWVSNILFWKERIKPLLFSFLISFKGSFCYSLILIYMLSLLILYLMKTRTMNLMTKSQIYRKILEVLFSTCIIEGNSFPSLVMTCSLCWLEWIWGLNILQSDTCDNVWLGSVEYVKGSIEHYHHK